MEIAIIGGGAAGFFSAITVKENYPAVIFFPAFITATGAS